MAQMLEHELFEPLRKDHARITQSERWLFDQLLG